jgi:hypothetical protein
MSSNDQTEETQLGVALDADPGFQQEQQEQNINNNYYEAAAVTNENKWNRNGFGGKSESNFCLESNFQFGG